MFSLILKINKKTLKFNNIKLNKKEFHKSKEPINLFSVDLDQIVVSENFKHNDEGFKYFIGNQKGNIVKPLCIILPQMDGYMKYFENGGKNMSFMNKDKVSDKYDKIWNVIKDKLGIKFHREPVDEYKYLRVKLREFEGIIKTNFLGKGVPKENMHYTSIACITTDSVMKMDKKYFLQVYLEECKYKVKKIQMPKFMNTELKSDSDSEAESENDTVN